MERGASVLAEGPRPRSPMFTWRPWHSGTQPGKGEGQLCPSTSRAHTLPAVPWIMGREGSGGRKVTPQSPCNHPGVPGALERAGWRGIGPFMGRKPAPGSILQDASKKCFKWFARTRRWGAGAFLGPFKPSFPQVMGTALSPATGPVPSHTHPQPRKHGDPRPPCAHLKTGGGHACATSLVPRSSQCALFRACVSVCVRVCVRCRVVKLCPSLSQTSEWPSRPQLCNFPCVS